jgi:glycosyltransferase involved in cell wall biosynthesis
MGSDKVRFDLVFVGNLGYHPNVEAVHWFVREVWPGLRQLRPGIRLLVAGARPMASIRRLADEQIRVSGWLPDIRDGYASGKVFVAPLFHGGGQQNKLLEAMSMELPCVTTPRVNASLQAPEGVGILEAGNPEAFLSKIHFLLEHPEEARRIGKAGRAFVQNRYTWERSTDQMEQELLSGPLPEQPPSRNSGR